MVGTLWALVRRLGFPPEYTILCFNCNSGRHINGGICPHKAPQSKLAVTPARDDAPGASEEE